MSKAVVRKGVSAETAAVNSIETGAKITASHADGQFNIFVMFLPNTAGIGNQLAGIGIPLP